MMKLSICDLKCTVTLLLLGLVFIGASGLLLTHWNDYQVYPDIQTVEVPKTPGRTYIHKEVLPGTFKITVPWEQAMEWGENAITSISFNPQSKDLLIESWIPDRTTSGVFQYATYKKRVAVPKVMSSVKDVK